MMKLLVDLGGNQTPIKATARENRDFLSSSSSCYGGGISVHQMKMMLTLTSLPSLISTAKLQHVSRSFAGDDHCSTQRIASSQKPNHISVTLGPSFLSRKPIKNVRRGKILSSSDSNRVTTDSSNTDSGNSERLLTDTQLSGAKPMMPMSSSVVSIQPNMSVMEEAEARMQEPANEPQPASDAEGDKLSSSSKTSLPKRLPLTAREKLRAARVLSRYTESKPAKSELGSKVLDALRESDGGKPRSGLPEAPTNLFDDSKRGLPKQGWTFDFPGGILLAYLEYCTLPKWRASSMKLLLCLNGFLFIWDQLGCLESIAPHQEKSIGAPSRDLAACISGHSRISSIFGVAG